MSGKFLFGLGTVMMVIGMALICYGYYASTFWYADPGAKVVTLSSGWRIYPGDMERVAGIVITIVGILLMFRNKQ